MISPHVYGRRFRKGGAMAKDTKGQLLPQARLLDMEGLDKAAIAAALGVSRRTVQRWAKQDAGAGKAWRQDVDRRRAARLATMGIASADPEEVTARIRCRLEARVEKLMAKVDKDVEGSALEDRLLKICKVLDYFRPRGDDPSSVLHAMKRFASFCTCNLSEEEMGGVRKGVRLFVESLRKEHL
jgi:transposase